MEHKLGWRFVGTVSKDGNPSENAQSVVKDTTIGALEHSAGTVLECFLVSSATSIAKLVCAFDAADALKKFIERCRNETWVPTGIEYPDGYRKGDTAHEIEVVNKAERKLHDFCTARLEGLRDIQPVAVIQKVRPGDDIYFWIARLEALRIKQAQLDPYGRKDLVAHYCYRSAVTAHMMLDLWKSFPAGAAEEEQNQWVNRRILLHHGQLARMLSDSLADYVEGAKKCNTK